MDAPNFVGIAIGLCFLLVGAFGWFKLYASQKRLAWGVSSAIFLFVGLFTAAQNLLFSYPSTWSWEGFWLYKAEFFGKLFAPIVLAFLGFIYRPNKLVGYVAVLVLSAIVLFL